MKYYAALKNHAAENDLRTWVNNVHDVVSGGEKINLSRRIYTCKHMNTQRYRHKRKFSKKSLHYIHIYMYICVYIYMYRHI